ncbi:MAG: type I-U CRISPR-associated protein Cas8c [Terrimicrobiaceae bacterium]|nr:type I-U CRISPR-associated protein Cas8c [Terrimicrobiaceae bacterium]
MSEASIPVDLYNPGQVFACLGFLEAADAILGDAEGGFDWAQPGNTFFLLRTRNESNPFRAILDYVAQSEVEWLSPTAEVNERDGGKTVVANAVSWSKAPSPADLPGRVTRWVGGEAQNLFFGFWADGSGRFSTTFKKSTNGASSHIRFRNCQEALREILNSEAEHAALTPLDVSRRTESLFRLDPRGYADPLNAGFSADNLRKGGLDVRLATFPICELFAVIGLEHARPRRISSQQFSYSVWSVGKTADGFLPPSIARAALGAPFGPLPSRCFLAQHCEVKRGGDRKIISVTELLTPEFSHSA